MTTRVPSRASVNVALGVAVAIAVATGVALLVAGGSSDPSQTDFLDTIRKPSWQPPDWVFGPVWTVLYITIAVSFVGAFRSVGELRWLVWRAFAINIALNAAWTPIFFGLELPWLAGLEILLLLASCVWLVGVAGHARRWCGLLLVPYTAWVSFATVLNWTIAILNL